MSFCVRQQLSKKCATIPMCRAMPAMDCLLSCRKLMFIRWQRICTKFQKMFVWSCKLKVHPLNMYLNARACHTTCKINPTESRTQNNLLSMRASRRKGPNPSQRLMWLPQCLTERAAGPHWDRQPTVFRQAESLPNCGEGSNRLLRNSLIPAKKKPRSARLSGTD